MDADFLRSRQRRSPYLNERRQGYLKKCEWGSSQLSGQGYWKALAGMCRKTDNLEVSHILRLFDGGEDPLSLPGKVTVQAGALCFTLLRRKKSISRCGYRYPCSTGLVRPHQNSGQPRGGYRKASLSRKDFLCWNCGHGWITICEVSLAGGRGSLVTGLPPWGCKGTRRL